MLTDLLKFAVHRWSFFSSPYDRLFFRTPNNLNSFHQKLLNIFILAMIEKNGIANSKIRPLWQALIILNYGVISTYYFERNNVFICLLHVGLMAGSRTLRGCESPQPDTSVWWNAFTPEGFLIGQNHARDSCETAVTLRGTAMLSEIYHMMFFVYEHLT